MDELTEKDVKFNQGEINALKKAILYLKFECEETSSLIFSGSELINSAFDKLLINSDSYEREMKFYYRENPDAKDFIEKKIKRQEGFNERDSEENLIDNEYVRCCMHPFK
ncbi:hypothetical protein ACR9H8_05495 [Kosakonia cowanii]